MRSLFIILRSGVSRKSRRGRISGAALAMACLLGVAAGTSSTAQAAPGSLSDPLSTCAGTSTTTYSPGLTPTPQTVNFTGSADLSCPLDLEGQTAHYEASGSGMLSCAPNLNSSSGTLTVEWGNGEESVIPFTTAVVSRPLVGVVLVSTGTVQSGRFEGQMMTNEAVLVPLGAPIGCVSGQGITEVTGAATLTFT